MFTIFDLCMTGLKEIENYQSIYEKWVTKKIESNTFSEQIFSSSPLPFISDFLTIQVWSSAVLSPKIFTVVIVTCWSFGMGFPLTAYVISTVCTFSSSWYEG